MSAAQKPSARALIRLPERLNLAAAAELRATLLAALAAEPAIVIDPCDVAECDLAAIQVIEAARRSAERINKSLTLAQPAAGALLNGLERAGLLHESRAEQLRFWKTMEPA